MSTRSSAAQLMAVAQSTSSLSHNNQRSIVSAADLADNALHLFNRAPAARDAVLEYVTVLICESVNMQLTQIENLPPPVNSETVTTAIDSLLEEIELIATEDDQLMLTLFQWCTTVLGQVLSATAHRSCLHRVTHTERITILMTSPALASLTQLLMRSFQALSRSQQTGCLSSVRHATQKDSINWVMQLVGHLMPSSVVSDLLSLAVRELSECSAVQTRASSATVTHSAATVSQHLYEQYTVHVRALATRLVHLSTTHSTQLQQAVHHLLKNGLRANASGQAAFCVPFLCKLLITSDELLLIVADTVMPWVSVSNLSMMVERVSAVTDWQSLVLGGSMQPNEQHTCLVALLVRTVCLLCTEYIALIIQHSLTLAADESLSGVASTCVAVVDVLVSKLVHNVMPSATYTTNELLLLHHLIETRFTQAIHIMLTGSALNQQFYMRLLIVYCLCHGAQKTCHVLSTILQTAQNTAQLSSVVHVVSSVRAYQSDCMLQLITDCDQYLPVHCSCLWPINLLRLFTWEQRTANNQSSLQPAMFIGLESAISSNQGVFACHIMRTATLPDQALSMQSVCVRLLLSLPTPLRLSPALCLRSTRSMAKHLQHLVTRQDCSARWWMLAEQLCSYISRVLQSQPAAATHLLVPLVFPTNDMERASVVAVPDNKEDEGQGCLLLANRVGPPRRRGTTATSLLHSGLLKHATRANEASPASASSCVSVHVAFSVCVLDVLSESRDHDHSYMGAVTRSLLAACCELTESSPLWHNYNTQAVNRHMAVAKCFERHPELWQVMSIIAQCAGCLYECGAVVQGVLGSLIAHTRHSPGRQSLTMNAHTLQQLDQLLLLLVQGGVLPERMLYLEQLMAHITQYEASLVLLDLWAFLQRQPACAHVGSVAHSVSSNGNLQVISQSESSIADIDQSAVQNVALVSAHHLILDRLPQFALLYPKLFPESITCEE